MASYINLDTLYIDYLKPSRFVLDVVGSAIEGGRNGLNQSISIEMAGGGFLTHSLGPCFIQDREEHEYLNYLGALLNGSFRFINVPIKSDWMGPFPTFDRWPIPVVNGIPHSDGALFSDTSGYSQATVWGKVIEDAPLNAGQLHLRIYNPSRPLRWSDWFSIYHSTKGWRAYRYWQVVTRLDDGIETISGTPNPYQEYIVALAPPLREAASAGTRIEFARPRCAMKLAPGSTVPWDVQGWWRASPTLDFVEAF
ncbi:hypothetical protein [Rhizobium sp. L51/94]|uniref:hypothetical protein n=1 Tax=Rhizobium sp. L51/94 TaxID=2819999 RepID=UPI001C5B47E0|nr:hypothetical protein [Rhizobium sp. L51/94]QXZ79669.1 hypothetical protein J5274_06715 [Rhizobium sp. L51/94]